MKFGVNVKADSTAVEFIQSCFDAGVRHIRLERYSSSFDVEIVAELARLGMKAYVVPFRFTETGDADALFKTISEGGLAEIRAEYAAVAEAFPVEVTMGIALPEGSHLVTRVGSFSTAGFRRDKMKEILNAFAAEIRAAGHVVVMPVRVDDIQGEVWLGLDFDIYDIEAMLSHNVSDALSSSIESLSRRGTPVWLGRAGTLGGYIAPACQVKALRKIRHFAKGSEYAFLWSEKAIEKFHWSRDGKFYLDLMKTHLQLDQAELNPNIKIPGLY